MFKISCETTSILIIEPKDYMVADRVHQQPIYTVDRNHDARNAWAIYGIKQYNPFNFETIKHREYSSSCNTNYDTFLCNISVDYCRIKSRQDGDFIPREGIIYQVLYLLVKQWKHRPDLIKPIFQIIDIDFVKYINREITENDYYFPT